MGKLILGLVLFLGIHSISIFALSLRDKFAAKSELAWKLFYSLVSIELYPKFRTGCLGVISTFLSSLF